MKAETEPRLLRAIARFLLPADEVDFILADLSDGYLQRRRRRGRFAASRWYWWQVVRAVPAAGSYLGTRLREANSSRITDGWGSDVRRAFRTNLRRPAYAAAVVATMGLGFGAAATILAVADGVWFRPLPFVDGDRVVRVFEVDRNPVPSPSGDGSPGVEHTGSQKRWRLSPPLMEDLRHADLLSVASVAAVSGQAFDWREADRGERLMAVTASPDILEVLGVRPVLGRGFMENLPNEVLLTDGFWKRVFGADPSAIGKTLHLDGISHRIVGVLPPNLPYPSEGVIWTPFSFDESQLTDGMRGARYLDVVARVRPGMSIVDASRELDAFVAASGQIHPIHKGWGATAVNLRLDLVQPYRHAITLLLWATVVFLLITAVNVAGLSAARLAESAHECALRAALGASRSRLARQTAVEGMVLALVGGAVAAGLAAWALGPIKHLAPRDVPRLDQVHLDLRIVGWLLLGTVVSGAITALVGKAMVGVGASEIVARGTGAIRLRHRGRTALLVTQISLATMLLVGGAVLLRYFNDLAEIEPGFEPLGVATAPINLSESRYPTPEQRHQFFDGVLSQFAARGVVAAVGTNPPISGSSMRFGYFPVSIGQTQYWAQYHTVSPEYFQILSIPLRRGRAFQEADATGPPVVIVNETLARMHFPNGDAVGQQLTVVSELRTVVGVVGDTRHFGPDQEAPAELYVPLAQDPWLFGHVLAAAPAPLPAGTFQEVVAAVDPTVTVTSLVPFRNFVVSWFAPLRFQLVIVSLLAIVGTLLGAVGIYGLVSFLVSRRTHEIGIRVALGAERASVAWSIIRQGIGIASAGIALGSAAVITLQRVLRTLIPGVNPTEPGTFLLVTMVVTAVTIVACAIPARRASSVDPVCALRNE